MPCSISQYSDVYSPNTLSVFLSCAVCPVLHVPRRLCCSTAPSARNFVRTRVLRSKHSHVYSSDEGTYRYDCCCTSSMHHTLCCAVVSLIGVDIVVQDHHAIPHRPPIAMPNGGIAPTASATRMPARRDTTRGCAGSAGTGCG